MYRQGDVLIARVDSIPQNRNKVADGILAHGEVTGHCHRIEDMQAAELLDCGGDGMFLSVGPDGVSIVHQEHAPIRLDGGNYKVSRQVEYTPAELRNVAD